MKIKDPPFPSLWKSQVVQEVMNVGFSSDRVIGQTKLWQVNRAPGTGGGKMARKYRVATGEVLPRRCPTQR